MVQRCKAAVPTEMPYWAKNYVTILVKGVIEWLTLLLANHNVI